MTALWPSSLPPEPRFDGWREVPRRPKVSFIPDAGDPIERRMGTVKLSDVHVRMAMTGEQVARLYRFIDDELSGGALRFYFSHPRSGTQVLARFVGEEPFEAECVGVNHYSVAFQLLVQS